MSKTEGSGKRSKADLQALRARIDHAIDLANWASQAPQQQTVARTFNDMLNELVGELARIAACYDLKQSSNDLQDMSALYRSEMEEGEQKYLDEARENLKQGMERLGCPPIN
jgi:hypothetical protein